MALNYGKRFKNQRTYIIGDMTPRNKNIGTMVAYKDLLISMPGPPQPSLDSFPEEFRQGMAARASMLNDTGDTPAQCSINLVLIDVL